MQTGRAVLLRSKHTRRHAFAQALLKFIMNWLSGEHVPQRGAAAIITTSSRFRTEHPDSDLETPRADFCTVDVFGTALTPG
jgi:hypothetical protein